MLSEPGEKMMEKAPWKSLIFLRYLGYQLPSWGLWALVFLILRQWFDFPWWVIPGTLSLWVAKDMILFSYVWRAYDPHPPERHPLDGSRGVVVKSLSPEGYIRIGGELWRAEVRSKGINILPGNTVEVRGKKGLTLLVDPASEEMGNPEETF